MQELRKLRRQLWHATKEEMARALRAANMPQDIPNSAPTVVKDCRVCRTLRTPARHTLPKLSLSTRLNQHVEYDILFYK
eukprot:2838642-Pyramimonas_sp.AAC.1